MGQKMDEWKDEMMKETGTWKEQNWVSRCRRGQSVDECTHERMRE